jgi:hypothetical protein
MTGTERKRAWRASNPERSQQAERERAQARRNVYWGRQTLGSALRPCASAESYQRYERTLNRFIQRTLWPRLGQGTATATDAEIVATGDTFAIELARGIRRIATLSHEELQEENRRLLAEMSAVLWPGDRGAARERRAMSALPTVEDEERRQGRLAKYARYNASVRGRARAARYEASPKGRARVARYKDTPLGIIAVARLRANWNFTRFIARNAGKVTL